MGVFDDLIPQQQSPAKSEASAFADLIPQRQASSAQPQELNLGERLASALPKAVQDWLSNPSIAGVGLGKGSAVHGAAMGMADPVVGAVQLVANAPGVNQALTPATRISDLVTGKAPGNPVNQAIDAKNAEYESARAAAGRDGFDAARFGGNVTSPANFAISQVAPIKAASTLGKVAQGVRAGAIGGAVAPVVNADDGFVAEKALQVGTGAVAGGVLTPVAAKAGEAVMRKIVGLSPAEISSQTDDIMREGVNRLRRDGIELSQDQIAGMRDQVKQALQQGQKIDAAAMFRKADFEALGMQPTLGQITRDGAQFSREKNLRGVAGVGEPLLERFDAQAKRLQEIITGKSAGAADDFTAGQQVMQSLKNVDEGMKGTVNAAYDKARDHLGRAAPMDSAAFSKAANLAIDDQMLGRWLPNEVRGILNDVTTGKIPLNVNTAVQIDSVLSQAQRAAMNSGNPAQAKAVGAVRDALSKTSIADNVGEDAKAAFDAARGMAASRFKTHEAIPALKAAADGDVSAQDFMRRYLINGKAEEVSNLAKVLPDEAKQEVRRQLGAALERAAFGENTAGGAAVSQERLAKFLNQPGMRQKLSAFFSQDEIGQIDRISRVSAYINSFPANHTVNTSNTASAAFNLLSRLPGVPQSLGVLNAAKNAAGNYSAVNSAMKANPAQAAADISPEKMKLLARVLGGGMSGVAGAAGTGIGN